MLRGTTRQGIWHILPGLAGPNKSLLPSQATTWQATETSSPAPLGAQLLQWPAREVSGSAGTSLHGD